MTNHLERTASLILPTLYQKTNTGAIQRWDIMVVVDVNDTGAWIVTHFGQDGGKIQTTKDLISSGKNAGKKNETSALQQAEKEAQAKWTKKKDREGYVEDIEQAKRGEDTRQGMAPMLAQPWEKVEKKFQFPADIQRKFNGNRLIAIIQDGVVTLWSRKQKPITGVPHIKAELEAAFKNTPGLTILDGECYRHGWSLQKISGFFRKEEPKEGFEELKYHVYDDASVQEYRWAFRCLELQELFRDELRDAKHIKMVETLSVSSIEEAWTMHDQFVLEGYEGAILRTRNTQYESDKRSHGLAKLKSFIEHEFKIIGIQEGRGKFAGKAVFSCEAENGEPFDCCAPGTMEDRAEFFAMGDSLIGKKLTVRYFELSEAGVPLFPVGLAVRDYE
jgi:DNA ligase-1